MATIKDSATPSLAITGNNAGNITLTITGTDALVEEQGYTYNQAAFTYNQAGVFYGGVYNANEDVVPMTLSARTTVPMNLFVSDIYGNNTVPVNNQKVVGPGWFLYVSQ